MRLNAEAHSAEVDRVALEAALAAQGGEFMDSLVQDHAHLFSPVAVFVAPEHVAQMQAVVEAVEEVVHLPAWRNVAHVTLAAPKCKGVFFGYDFHIDEQGAHLIEINTNAGGAFLNAVLQASQQPDSGLRQTFLEMFFAEWRLERGDEPLRTVAIVDEAPQSQYLYPEFILARQMFEQAGVAAFIVAPQQLDIRDDGVYCGNTKIDLVYNRLTDFYLQQHAALLQAYQSRQVVLTPHPRAYSVYADKRNLVTLTDADWLTGANLRQWDKGALLAGVPATRLVQAEAAAQWWEERKQWFFKPVSGYGSKGAYRGDKMTKRVFEEVMQSGGYIAQRLAPPGERAVEVQGEVQSLKYDVRCYVYDGRIQLMAARLYQGQTTNFRTPGGGFAMVRVLEQ